MSYLDPFEPTGLRKSRSNSSMILKRVASNLSSNYEEEHRNPSFENSSGNYKDDGGMETPHAASVHDGSHEHGHGHGHGHHHPILNADEAMVMCLSAHYGKLLVVIGMGFPIAKGLSHDLPLIFYNSFYLYLYFGSILFVIYSYVSLLSSFTMQVAKIGFYLKKLKVFISPVTNSIQKFHTDFKTFFKKPQNKKMPEENGEAYKSAYRCSIVSVEMHDMDEGIMDEQPSKFVYTEDAGHGSMYLKMGTIVFGIGSMIYSGLEFGHYFELKSSCSDILMAITPASRMVFTFLQMYFIFLNSRVSISRHTVAARFGLMHMVATNLCIWLNVLVEETKHTIHMITHEGDHGGGHGSDGHGSSGGHGHADDHGSADDHGHADDQVGADSHGSADEHVDDHHGNPDDHHASDLAVTDHSDHGESVDLHETHDDEHDLHGVPAESIFDHENITIDPEMLLDGGESMDVFYPLEEAAFSHFNETGFGADFFNITSVITTTVMPNEFSIKNFDGLFDTEGGYHNLVKRASGGELDGCQVINLMGDMVNSSASFLYPCTIEYSLLCASVLYAMWKNVHTESEVSQDSAQQQHLSQLIARKVRHLYSVDCGRASRGLFSGIFILVWTLISLIIFYVLVSEPHFKYYGVLSANISEILIYIVGIVTTIIGMSQLRKLGFIEEEETELDNVLLVIAQSGVYMFTIFTLIGGYFTASEISALPLISALVNLIQATLQTLYILDGSTRCCRTADQLDKKYGREMVTFSLTLNLAMWLFSTFQTSRPYLHKAQQEFYGVWAWTIINHVSMPLAIFYRFHATVCLGEIWKRAYKIKNEE